MSSEKCCSFEDIPKNQLIMGDILRKRHKHAFHVPTCVCVCIGMELEFYNNTN